MKYNKELYKSYGEICIPVVVNLSRLECARNTERNESVTKKIPYNTIGDRRPVSKPEQDWQCTYNLTLKRVCETVIAVE
jgi:hypothetical protein